METDAKTTQQTDQPSMIIHGGQQLQTYISIHLRSDLVPKSHSGSSVQQSLSDQL